MGHNDRYLDDPADDSLLWEPNVDAVPPVVGRVDRRTREPLMRYETAGEVSDPSCDAGPSEHWETDDGVDVSITF
jgi:hypothetical protein